MSARSNHNPRLNAWLCRTFLVGTTLAVALIALGLVLMLRRSGAHVSFRDYVPVAEELRKPRLFLSACLRADPLALAQTGVLVLCLTPVLRVAVAAIAFALDRDRLYALICLLSLVGLAAGLLGIVR